ncbi:hypothetical protein ALC57_15395 [Trachymyrmex cornetzi]|uniref:Uncharacterized protein n=1 Tax=Trachymyrmex cornetzi TaxID=471704 RepID=A0A151IX83_9HYME|nr:hypothetical protein ALC57_15395 [Trachymyrmex cornetzi]
MEWMECMKETERRIRELLGVIEKERGKERKVRGWWDRECREKRGVLREWRKELCEAKKREENERWERKVEVARNESQVWEIVNGERKRRKEINKGIEMKEWEDISKSCWGA